MDSTAIEDILTMYNQASTCTARDVIFSPSTKAQSPELLLTGPYVFAQPNNSNQATQQKPIKHYVLDEPLTARRAICCAGSSAVPSVNWACCWGDVVDNTTRGRPGSALLSLSATSGRCAAASVVMCTATLCRSRARCRTS